MESLLSWPTDDGGTLGRDEIVGWWESRRLRFNLLRLTPKRRSLRLNFPLPLLSTATKYGCQR